MSLAAGSLFPHFPSGLYSQAPQVLFYLMIPLYIGFAWDVFIPIYTTKYYCSPSKTQFRHYLLQSFPLSHQKLITSLFSHCTLTILPLLYGFHHVIYNTVCICSTMSSSLSFRRLRSQAGLSCSHMYFSI